MAEQPNGLVALQNMFLSDIMGVDNVEIHDVTEGIELIKDVAGRTRLFFILDNVNKLDQLNALARSKEWFGSGSRIIITTRDPQLLSVLEVDNVYGEQGIEVIETQFRQNLQMITDLEEPIRRSCVQPCDEERSLIAEIEVLRRKNNGQAQIIAELQQNSNPGLPLYGLDSATEALLDGRGHENSEPYDEYKTLLHFVPENEILIGDANVNDEYKILLQFVPENEILIGDANVNDKLKAKMKLLNAGSKHLNQAGSSKQLVFEL